MLLITAPFVMAEDLTVLQEGDQYYVQNLENSTIEFTISYSYLYRKGSDKYVKRRDILHPFERENCGYANMITRPVVSDMKYR